MIVIKRTIFIFCGYFRNVCVYAYGEEDLSTGICSRTKLLANADEDLKELAEGNVPTIEGSNLPYKYNLINIFAMIGVVLVVLVIAILIIKKHR